MKKLLSLLLAGIMMVGTLSACGDKKDTEKDGKIQLSISHWPNEAASPKSYARMMGLKADFEAANPDIEIVPDEWQYDLQTYMAKAEAGTLPVLYRAFLTEINKIKELGYASDLTDVAKKYGYYDKISDNVKEMVSEGDKLYFVPSSTYTLGLMVNLDLFKQAGVVDENGKPEIPTTFDELAVAATTISEKTGKAGFVFPTAENGGGWIFTVLAWNFGGSFMEEQDGKWQATFADNKSVDALQWLKDMKWKNNALPATTKINNAEVIKLIGTGQAAMAILHPDQLTGLVAQYGMDTSSIGFAQIPAGPERHVTLMGGEMYVVSDKATDEQIDAAFRWLEFNNHTVTDLTEEGRERLRESYQQQADEKKVIGVYDVPILSADSEKQKYRMELTEEFRNIPIENVERYNNKDGVELQTEERICAQDLYSILDGCIQEVFTNQDADCKEVMKKAASDFQNNFLNYEN